MFLISRDHVLWELHCSCVSVCTMEIMLFFDMTIILYTYIVFIDFIFRGVRFFYFFSSLIYLFGKGTESFDFSYDGRTSGIIFMIYLNRIIFFCLLCRILLIFLISFDGFWGWYYILSMIDVSVMFVVAIFFFDWLSISIKISVVETVLDCTWQHCRYWKYISCCQNLFAHK